jgi:hypothetical protein
MAKGSKRPDIDEDLDDVRKIAAWAESKAQLRSTAAGASRKGVEGFGASLLTTEIPTDVDKETAFDAIANLEAFEAYEKKLTDAELASEAEEMFFFLRCTNCRRPAIYFTRNPAYGGSIGRREWYSRYKKADEVHYNPIVCQVHMAKGVTNMYAPIEWSGQNTMAPDAVFNPHPRHTFKVPKDPAMAKFVGACRVWRVPGEVCNDHIAVWEEKLAKWRAMGDDEKKALGWKPKTEEVAHAG